MFETPEDPVYENNAITPGKNKEACLSQEEDVTYAQVKIRTPPKAVDARSSQEEDVTYSQVNIRTAQRSPKAAEAGSPQEDDLTYSEVRMGSQPQKAPEQRSKCTKRVVLLVATAVFVLAVIAIIIAIILKTQSKEKSEAQKQNTTPAPEQTTGKTSTSTSSTGSVTPCTNIMVQCDEDWELHGEKCYFFSPNTVKLSWTYSREKCQQLRGNLVKIESEEEQKFLFNTTRSLMDEAEADVKFWIGLTDSETEGVWLWTDGSRLNTKSAFWFNNTALSGNEPDNWAGGGPEGEDCVRMGERGEGFELKCWFDQSCFKKNRFICEKQACK